MLSPTSSLAGNDMKFQEDIPPRPAGVAHNWKYCTCGIRCNPPQWRAPSTYRRHQEEVRWRDQAIREQRPVMAYGRGLRREINEHKTAMKKQRAANLYAKKQQKKESAHSIASSSRTQQTSAARDGSEDYVEVDPEHHNIDDSPSNPEENSFEYAYMPSTEGTTGSRQPEDHDGRDIDLALHRVEM